jgi:hypothetical protein
LFFYLSLLAFRSNGHQFSSPLSNIFPFSKKRLILYNCIDSACLVKQR